MNLDDLKSKASEALNSDKGEELSDQALGRAADVANNVTGGKFGDQVEQARDAADSQLGNA